MTFRTVTRTVVAAAFATSPAFAQAPAQDDHAAHAMQTPAAAQAPQFTRPANDKVPPGNAEAPAELESSTLKNEWVSIP